MRRTASAILETARRGNLFAAYNKAVGTVQTDFWQWVRSAPREDLVLLIRDGWEVATRAGREAGPEPRTQEEASALLASLHDTLGEAGCVAMMVLWRRHRRGRRYYSPFKKETGHDQD